MRNEQIKKLIEEVEKIRGLPEKEIAEKLNQIRPKDDITIMMPFFCYMDAKANCEMEGVFVRHKLDTLIKNLKGLIH